MARVKGGVTSRKRRSNVLSLAKGFRHGNKSKFKLAKVTLLHAGNNAFNDRRKKKGVFRRLWQTRINAQVRKFGISYSKFIDGLNKKNIQIDRKILSQLSQEHPNVVEKIVKEIK